MKRRKYLGLLGLGAFAAGSRMYTRRQEELSNPLGLPEERIEKDNYWTVSVLPDSQNYASNPDWTYHAREQAEWIVENQDDLNIEFATHEGDLVDDGSSEAQWNRIESALAPLDAKLPYSVTPGNHDWNRTYDKSSGIEGYRDRFGEERFDHRSWYLETDPYGLSHAQTFSGGDYRFMHLGLEYEPRDETLEWAEELIEEYGLPTILTTHSHLHKGVLGTGRYDEVHELDGEGNHAEEVFDRLVSPNPEIFMVLSGHSFGGVLPRNSGEHRQVSLNDEGEPVYEMLADFQDRDEGGNGWMRNITFLPVDDGDKDRISVSTYSPSLERNQMGGASDFSFELDFDRRF